MSNRKTVLVNQASTIDKKGFACITKAPASIQEVDAIFIDGTVRTTVGDVWQVKPCNNGKADFVTCEPYSYEG